MWLPKPFLFPSNGKYFVGLCLNPVWKVKISVNPCKRQCLLPDLEWEKRNKFEVLFIICLRLNEGLLGGSQSLVDMVTEIMTSIHSWLKIIFHLTGVLVFTFNSCCFPICSLTEMALIMTLDNEHPAGNGMVVLCSLNRRRQRPLQPLAVLWSCQCFDFPAATLVQRNRFLLTCPTGKSACPD